MQTLLLLSAIVVLAVPWPFQEEPVGIRMIVVPTRADAEALRIEIESGTPFDALARAHSIDPSSGRGGFLGVIRAGDLGGDLRDGLSGLGDQDTVSAVTPLGTDFALLDFLSDAEIDWYAAMDEARQLVGRGQLDEARAFFRQAVDLAQRWGGDTRLASSVSGLGTTFLGEGRYERAEPFFRRAVAVREEVSLSVPNLELLQALNDLAGTVYRRAGDLAEVESLFSRSLEISREAFGDVSAETATALNNLGLVVRDRGRYDEASALFTEAVTAFGSVRGPTSASVQATLDALAGTLRLGGKLDEAEATARRSLEIAELNGGRANPSNATAIAGLADVLADQGRAPEAIELYEEALALAWKAGRDVVAVLDVFVDAMFAAPFGGSERERALEELDAVLAEADQNLLSAMGRLFLAARFDREAAFVLGRMVERFPDSWQARYQLAEAHAEMESFEEALEVYDTIQPASDRERSVKLRRTGDMMASLERLDAAFDLYERAIGADAENIDAWLARAELFLYTGDEDGAVLSYEGVLDRDPEHVSALAALADIRLHSGRFDEAVSLARQAVGLDDTNRGAHYALAQALLRSGQSVEGNVSLERYRELLEMDAARDQRDREMASVLAHRARGDAAAAAAVLREAIVTYPDATRILLDLGLVELRLGNVGAAIEALEARRDRGAAGDFLVHRALEDAYRSAGRPGDAERSRADFLQAIGEALEAAVE